MGRLDRYYRIERVAGVHLQIMPDGSTLIQVCSVFASGNELQIDKRIKDLTSIVQLKEHLPPKQAIALVISGKGVLQKQVEKIDSVDQTVFGNILPNAKIADFYVQNFISGNTSFVSLIRKTEADRWIGELTGLEYQPLMLSLGPFVMDTIMPQLNIYEQEFIVNGYQISRNEQGSWTGASYEESATSAFSFKLASERVDEKLIIPYAAAFQLVLCNNIEIVSVGTDYLEAALEKKLSDQKVKVQGSLILIGLFSILLINFVFFSWLNSSNNALTVQVSRYNLSTSNQEELSQQIKQKEARLKQLGWDGGLNKSILIDQVASMLPPEITLKEIAVNPVDPVTTRSQKTISFMDRKMRIVGVSEQIIAVNEWIARIKTRPWVKNVQLESYGFNNELNTGQFAINIEY
jgi:hypothetical protein